MSKVDDTRRSDGLKVKIATKNHRLITGSHRHELRNGSHPIPAANKNKLTKATKGMIKVNKHRHKGQQLSLTTTSSTEKKRRTKATKMCAYPIYYSILIISWTQIEQKQ